MRQSDSAEMKFAIKTRVFDDSLRVYLWLLMNILIEDVREAHFENTNSLSFQRSEV